MEKINIGFDLGVTSVGWSVYSVTNDVIIDKGVKLFYQADRAEDRRGHRALRRRYKRQNHRIERFGLLLKENKLEFAQETDNNLLQKRIIGQKSEINDQDLINILRFFLKYRGYNPTADDTRENEYKHKHPNLVACELQQIILEKEGHYRGLEYPFLIEDFKKEISLLLKKQMEYKVFIDERFVKSYFEIFNSRREFWEGPGGNKESQLTPFGRYRNKEDLEKLKENSDYRKYLYQELIKDCSVYMNEKSVSKDNYYAQRFNFLNDMLNLRFNFDLILPKYEQYFEKLSKDTYVLNVEGINLIENAMFTSSSTIIKSIFKKLFEIDITKVTGFRVDRSRKIEVTKFDLYNKVRRAFEKNDYNLEIINDKEKWNQLCEIKAIVPASNQAEQIKEKINIDFTDAELKQLVKETFTGQYHSYGERALKKYIAHMENLLINSSTLEKKYPELINNEVEQHLVDTYFADDRTINMSKSQIDDLVASPQVKKTLRKAITTFNQIRKEYSKKDGYVIDKIIIESNKDILSDEQKARFEEAQLDNERLRMKALKEIEHLIKPGDNKERLIEKQVLLMETNYKCVYCDDTVNIDNMEVEHILPISKSANNSMNNKVCSCRTCNHDKGNKTPYEFIGYDSERWEVFIKQIDKLKLSSDKYTNLTFTDNIDKYEKRFISRNLRDTAYATKEFKNQFKIYQNALIQKRGMKEELMFDIIAMPPQITGLTRRRLMEDKDRSKQYHHAFDATICAMYPTTKLGALSNKIQNQPDKYWMAKALEENIEELTTKFNFTQNQVASLKDINMSNTRFHTEVKTNPNGQLCNADINKVITKEVGTTKKPKQEYRKIEYISNIYELEKDSLKKLGKMLTDEKAPNTLGIKYNDKPTFDFIKQIYLEHVDLKWKDEKGKDIAINPFVHYCCEEHNVQPKQVLEHINKYGIRPPSKKGKQRPVIKRLNYDKKVNQPFLLDKKSINKKEENLIMLDSLNAAYTIVFENLDKGGFLFLPVYSVTVDLKTGEPNTEHHYYKQLYSELIGNTNVKELFKVRARDYLSGVKKDGQIVKGAFSHYDKTTNVLTLKSKVDNKRQFLTKSYAKLEKIDVYGLGIYGMNLDE